MLIEHTFGIPKARWSCPLGLRIGIGDKEDEGRPSWWVRACAVLDNLLIEIADMLFNQQVTYPTGDEAEQDLAREASQTL